MVVSGVIVLRMKQFYLTTTKRLTMKKVLQMAFLLLFIVAGCGPSSKITSSWKADDAAPQKFKKIVVVGIIREADRTLREKMEQHLAADLRDLGYDATCSCDEYNPKTFENMSEEQVISKMRNAGVDAVLTVVLLDKMKERYYVPGRVRYTPYVVYHNRFWIYTRTVYDRIYTEGYYTENTRYFWETNLYNLAAKGQQLVYSAQSQSFDPLSSETLGHEYGQMIAKDMVKKNVLTDLKTTPVMKAM
jgi:hypothetical protein